MRKEVIVISLILLIIAPQLSHAESMNLYPPYYDIDKSGDLYTAAENINPDIIKQDKETEGPLRRFEVTFFISLPFVFIVNFLALHSYEVIRQKNFNVNVWNEHQVLLPAGTLVLTSAIAFRSAYIGSGSPQREGAASQEERSFFFCAVKNY